MPMDCSKGEPPGGLWRTSATGHHYKWHKFYVIIFTSFKQGLVFNFDLVDVRYMDSTIRFENKYAFILN